MKTKLMLAALIAVVACSERAHEVTDVAFQANRSANTVTVDNNNASGAGSIKAAVAAANADAQITHIEFTSDVGTIALAQALVFTGAQDLVIRGRGAAVDGSAVGAGALGALVFAGGGDVTIHDLAVHNSPVSGVTVDVPDAATGTIRIELLNVAATDNNGHGVIINDQQEYFNDPDSESDLGSSASLDVVIKGGSYADNGFAALDRDGIRINEGGAGDLKVEISHVDVLRNGGDGIEFDERGAGDVLFDVAHSKLNDNGGFSSADFDDGLDIDEQQDGSIIGTLRQTEANRNFEQGLDLNENHAGDLRVDLIQVTAIGNNEEGIEYEEDDDFAGGGNIVARLVGVVAKANGGVDGDAGLKLREKGAGDLTVTGVNLEGSDNAIDGILLREDAAGTLTGELRNTVTTGNNGDGIELTGTGTVLLVNHKAANNSASDLKANSGVAVTQQ